MNNDELKLHIGFEIDDNSLNQDVKNLINGVEKQINDISNKIAINCDNSELESLTDNLKELIKRRSELASKTFSTNNTELKKQLEFYDSKINKIKESSDKLSASLGEAPNLDKNLKDIQVSYTKAIDIIKDALSELEKNGISTKEIKIQLSELQDLASDIDFSGGAKELEEALDNQLVKAKKIASYTKDVVKNIDNNFFIIYPPLLISLVWHFPIWHS